jgi:16S rRNA G1207 methylase RsmC
LAWLVTTRLAAPQAEVEWHIDRSQGPKSVARMLREFGWAEQSISRDRDTVRIDTVVPASALCPQPASFSVERAGRRLTFAADYGVFSPGRIDDGTALLIDNALREPQVDAVADIGVGYGPIAVTLVAEGHAGMAYGTDVDSIALALAAHNAATNDVPLEVVASPDPLALPPTPMTVCNIPTHINAEATDRLCAALARRAQVGMLLVVVHASLEQRYVRRFTDAGLRPSLHPGPAHIVLRCG